MIKTSINKLTVFKFEILSPFTELQHFSTIREGGTSTGSYHSLNLGLSSGDHPAEVLENRNILCNSLQIPYTQLILPKQTHSRNVKIIKEDFEFLTKDERQVFLRETDALITDVKGIAIAVKTADCVPILLFDHKKKIIATIHAGWRGTLSEITLITVKKMILEFGSSANDIFAGIGPSISPDVYEVGKEVWELFDPLYHTDAKDHTKRFLNLWKANYLQLTGSGVPAENIETAGLCTWSNPSLFYSARRDGIKTGRMATGIMLK